MKNLLLACLLWLLMACLPAAAQETRISGQVTDSTGRALERVIVLPQGRDTGILSDSTGRFVLRLADNAPNPILLTFKLLGFSDKKMTVRWQPGVTTTVQIRMDEAERILDVVEVGGMRERSEAGTTFLQPRTLQQIPTPTGDFMQALKSIGLGITGNNELSSTYSVRGGSYDENLVYVNNIQIYRPFITRAGQQEGLSFINPELVRSVEFSSGGWQSKYGDKLSSVLNVTYKRPKRAAASAVAGLLGVSLHAEGVSRSKKFSYITGFRYQSARYLFNTLPTRGQYIPRFVDWQSFLTWDITPRTSIELLTGYARNQYDVFPRTRVTNFGTFGQALRLLVAYEGAESLSYDTFQGGAKLSHRPNDRWTLEWISSAMITQERERFNVEAAYRIADVPASAPDPVDPASIRGIGSVFDYGRNRLQANIYAFESRNARQSENKKHLTEFGVRYDHERITDDLHEYSFFDSADFVRIQSYMEARTQLESHRLSGYAQHTWLPGTAHRLHAGIRLNHWNLNGQTLYSPRLQYSYRPTAKSYSLHFSAGLYQQPPFYREMRNFQGAVNTGLLAQRAWHFIAGYDRDFKKWGRPFRFVGEVYYKHLSDLVAYDIDNVRLRYYGLNNATGYAQGVDFRVNGEFVKGIESWFALSLLQTMEDVVGDGRGYIRRPTDQRFTLSCFVQDHLPGDPTWQFNFRLLYGSGLPFGPPGDPRLRQVFQSGAEYRRVDVGFSKLIAFKAPTEHGPRRLESIWIGLDILNVIGADNTISFNWLQDFNGTSYAIPNTLSQRFFNLRVIVRY